MKVALSSVILVTILEGTRTIALESAPEPVWMLLWGIILLGLAAVARSMRHTRERVQTHPATHAGEREKYGIRETPQGLEGRA